MNTTKFIPLLAAGMIAVSLTAYLAISTNMLLVNATTLDDQAHALTVKGIHSVSEGDYESAIRYYKEALKARPNDRGIQMALGQVFYLREKEAGQIRPNPKVEVLLDALEYGKGDWEASIRYLENALEAEKDRPRAQAIRDALNYTKGLYAESIEELQFEEEYRELLDDDIEEAFTEHILRPMTMEELGRGFKSIEEGDYEQAIHSFKSALGLNPNDPRIRDMLSYAEGLNLGQYDRMKRWAERQQAKYENLRDAARSHEAAAQRALEQSQNALSLSRELKDNEAATISQKAINIAQRALAKAQDLLLKLEGRLQAVEKTRSLGSKGRVGVASVLKGKVFRKTAKGWVSFDAHAPLAAGDQLRTGADGFAEFVFTDGSIIHIAPNSTLTLHKIGEKSSTYELLKGRFHAEMECLKATRESCREVRMGRGFVLSVRGTEFDIDMAPDGSTTVTVINGIIEITDENSGEKIEIAECEQAVISFDGAIEKPVPIKLNSLKHWWEDMQ